MIKTTTMFSLFGLYLLFGIISLIVVLVLVFGIFTGLVVNNAAWLILLFSGFVLCSCGYSLLVYGRKYVLDQNGITVIWPCGIKKEHPWSNDSIIYICDLEMQRNHHFSLSCFVLFYDSTMQLTKERSTESWHHHHPRKSAYFYYDRLLESQIRERLPQININRIISDSSLRHDLNPISSNTGDNSVC
ncbi:MAG: hypothetical protein E7424_03340 [Ruminococcaceae bacterium]|nr:hypothetical protein [Oscillospiraceae bacterium]